jgi:hypothetical protein
MTHDAALALVRDTLRGQEITSDMMRRPVPAFTVVSREALATLVDGDWMVRPLGVLESEAKRERAENGDGADRTAPQDQGTGLHLECEPDNGAGLSVRTAPASAPILCAECGVPLEQHEIDRIPDAKGTKFEQLCNDCCYRALGLR